MTINEQLDMLEKAIKSNNTNEIENIKHKIIHPDNGAYFGLYIKHVHLGNGEFLFNDKIFSYIKKIIFTRLLRCVFAFSCGLCVVV